MNAKPGGARKRRKTAKPAAPARGSARSFVPRKRRYWLPSPLLVLEVRGKEYERVFIGYAENLSLGGLMLSTPKQIKPGDRFPVQFVLPDRTSTVNCTCEVVWKKDSHPGVPSTGVGLRFVGIGDESRKVLDQWIRREGKQLTST